MHRQAGPPFPPPERLLKALLLQIPYAIRSERALMEHIHFNILFRWFVGLSIDEPVWDHLSFSKNRDRLIHADIALSFLNAVLSKAEKEAKLCYTGHILTENRNGLVVNASVTLSTGTCEREAAEEMLSETMGDRKATVGADEAYHTKDFVEKCRKMKVTPHAAQKAKVSAIDSRTTCHAGYGISQRKRKRFEDVFGWGKTVGGLRKLHHRRVKKQVGCLHS